MPQGRNAQCTKLMLLKIHFCPFSKLRTELITIYFYLFTFIFYLLYFIFYFSLTHYSLTLYVPSADPCSKKGAATPSDNYQHTHIPYSKKNCTFALWKDLIACNHGKKC